MYEQTDGVAMGLSLVLALANIFVGYYEEKLFSQTQKPPIFFRYVDATFAIFDGEAEADEFLTKLYSLHPYFKFTFEKEKQNVYRFLMSISKEQILALKPVYCIPETNFHWSVFALGGI